MKRIAKLDANKVITEQLTLPLNPDVYRTAYGVLITNFSMLPMPVLNALGWYEEIFEPTDETSFLSEGFEFKDNQIIYRAIPRDINQLSNEAQDRVNVAAGFARAKYVPKGELQQEEYRLVREAAKSWAAQNFDENTLPPCIGVSAEIRGNTPQVECEQILLITENLEVLLTKIRATRLYGNEQIKAFAVAGDHAGIIAARDKAIEILNTI